MLNQIGGGKNPTARISLNILVNANRGNDCLKALSMCWAAWAPGQEVLQLATPMPREGKHVSGRVRATWGTTGLTEYVPNGEKTFHVRKSSFYGAAL